MFFEAPEVPPYGISLFDANWEIARTLAPPNSLLSKNTVAVSQWRGAAEKLLLEALSDATLIAYFVGTDTPPPISSKYWRSRPETFGNTFASWHRSGPDPDSDAATAFIERDRFNAWIDHIADFQPYALCDLSAEIAAVNSTLNSELIMRQIYLAFWTDEIPQFFIPKGRTVRLPNGRTVSTKTWETWSGTGMLAALMVRSGAHKGQGLSGWSRERIVAAVTNIDQLPESANEEEVSALVRMYEIFKMSGISSGDVNSICTAKGWLKPSTFPSLFDFTGAVHDEADNCNQPSIIEAKPNNLKSDIKNEGQRIIDSITNRGQHLSKREMGKFLRVLVPSLTRDRADEIMGGLRPGDWPEVGTRRRSVPPVNYAALANDLGIPPEMAPKPPPNKKQD